MRPLACFLLAFFENFRSITTLFLNEKCKALAIRKPAKALTGKKNSDHQNLKYSLISDQVTNRMSDLTVSISNHGNLGDEIGFMDDDDTPSSGSISPHKHVTSSSSMTSTGDVTTTDSESNANGVVLESKSEIESSEKTQVVNGTAEKQNAAAKKLKNKNALLDGLAEGRRETGSEFDSELDETGFVEDLRDSDEE